MKFLSKKKHYPHPLQNVTHYKTTKCHPTLFHRFHHFYINDLFVAQGYLNIILLSNGPHGLGNGSHGLDNGPHGLDNGPHRLDNGPRGLGNGPHGLGYRLHELGIF